MTSNANTSAFRTEVAHHWNATTLGESTKRAVFAVLATLMTWQARADERQQLASLDNRMLADIGMTRAEARYESSKPFWRD